MFVAGSEFRRSELLSSDPAVDEEEGCKRGETSLMIANWRRSSQMEKDYDSLPTPDLTPISNNHQLIIAEIETRRVDAIIF